MPKPKDPESYPPEYYAVLDKVLLIGEHNVEGMTKKQAESLRFDLYAFRKALKMQLPDIGHKYTQISFMIRPMKNAGPNPLETAPIWRLWLVSSQATIQAQKISESLGDVQEVVDANPLAVPTIDEDASRDSSLSGVLSEFFPPDAE